jgi:hypothetical protein
MTLVADLLERALHFRALAKSIRGPKTNEGIQAVAAEYEARAANILSEEANPQGSKAQRC